MFSLHSPFGPFSFWPAVGQEKNDVSDKGGPWSTTGIVAALFPFVQVLADNLPGGGWAISPIQKGKTVENGNNN